MLVVVVTDNYACVATSQAYIADALPHLCLLRALHIQIETLRLVILRARFSLPPMPRTRGDQSNLAGQDAEGHC